MATAAVAALAPVILQTVVPEAISLASKLATQAMQTGVYTQAQIDTMWAQSRTEWEAALKDWQASATTQTDTPSPSPPKPT